MAVSIGGIILNDSLQISNFYSQPSLMGSVRYTIGGVVSQKVSMSEGKKFDLVAEQGSSGQLGFFTGAQIQSIAGFRDAGEPVSFVHPQWQGNVIIPIDGISVDKMLDYQYPNSTAWYSGTITLITVA